MKVAYVFSTSGHTASYKLGKMILPQLEQGTHGVEVVGLFFFDDNNYILRKGDPIGERLAQVAAEQGILLMMCDQCAVERGLAEGEPGTFPSPVEPVGTVEGVQVGCFPDLYTALAGWVPPSMGAAANPATARLDRRISSRRVTGCAVLTTGSSFLLSVAQRRAVRVKILGT